MPIPLFRRLLLAATVCFLLAGGLCASPAARAQDKAPLFINLSTDDPWKVAMAAFFGTNFGLKQGHKPVIVFVSVQATPAFHKRQAAARSEQFGRSLHEMYREFIDAGGRILVCPVCMKATGMAKEDLFEGAEVATIQAVNDVLFRPETKTLAW